LNRFSQNHHNPDKNMIQVFKSIVALLFAAALVAVAGTGCNTAHGFGKDISNAGESIQNGTK
jgi:predicted small secreted protein